MPQGLHYSKRAGMMKGLYCTCVWGQTDVCYEVGDTGKQYMYVSLFLSPKFSKDLPKQGEGIAGFYVFIFVSFLKAMLAGSD